MDGASKASDPISEHLQLKAAYQSQASRWKEERERLDLEVQRRQDRLDQLKSRMGRFMKVCNEQIGQMGREPQRGTHGEYRLDVIYEQLDDHEMRSLGRHRSPEPDRVFTPLDRDSSDGDSQASRNDFGRLSRFSDASELALRHSASVLLLSHKKRDPSAGLRATAAAPDQQRTAEKPRPGLQRATAAPPSDSPDTDSLPLQDRHASAHPSRHA